MNLSGYLAVIKRWWWTLLMATWVAGIAGYFIASGITPTFEARARLIVGPVSANIDTQRASAALIPTYAELATSEPLLQSVVDKLALSDSAGELRQRVGASANQTTRVLTIRAENESPAVAAGIANEMGRQLIELVPSGVTLPEGELSVVEQAQIPSDPVAPEVGLLVLLAAMAGLVGALLLVLLVEYFSDTVKDRDEIAGMTDAPILGSMRMPVGFHRGSSEPLFVEALPNSKSAAALRLIATKVVFAPRATPVRSIVVIGTDDEKGSGELAANLGAVITRSGRHVTLIDVNEDSAEMTTILSIIDRPGVTQLIEAAAGGTLTRGAVDGVVLHRRPGMEFVPRGVQTPQLTNAEASRRLIAELLQRADTVVANAAPVHRSGSALVWASVCDAVVLVVRRDKTKRESLVHALESLRLIGANLAGIVVIDRSTRLSVEEPTNYVGKVADNAPVPMTGFRAPEPQRPAGPPRFDAEPARPVSGALATTTAGASNASGAATLGPAMMPPVQRGVTSLSVPQARVGSTAPSPEPAPATPPSPAADEPAPADHEVRTPRRRGRTSRTS